MSALENYLTRVVAQIGQKLELTPIATLLGGVHPHHGK